MTAVADEATRSTAQQAVQRLWPKVQLVGVDSLTGHSGLTLRAALEGPGVPPVVVLKCCPPDRAASGRHDVMRQGQLLRDLKASGAVPVPSVLAFSADHPPAMALEWVNGVVEEPVLGEAPEPRPESVIRRRALEAAKTLAALHGLDPWSLPSARGESPAGPGEELRRWQPTMDTVDPDLRSDAGRLQAALQSSIPPPVEPALIHGDFRLGNILCDGGEIKAVIDWEIWSVGDPRVDFAWMRVFSSPECLAGIAAPIAGMPEPAELLTAYESGPAGRRTARGRTVSMTWFDALARYKMAAIMGNNLRRHRTGRRVDPFQERLVTTIPALIADGLRLLS